MKTILFVLILLTISVISDAQKSFISGTIKGFENDTLTIYILKMDETPIIEQVVCVEGKLNYEVQLADSLMYFVRIASRKWDKWNVNAYPYNIKHGDINFFLNSGDCITFTAEPRLDGIFCQVSGNAVNEQRNEFTRLLFPFYARFNSHCMKYAKAKEEKDSVSVKTEVELIEQIKGQIEKRTIDFIVAHPDWEHSAEVLMTLPIDSCYKYYGLLGPKARSSIFGISAKDILFAVKAGDQAPMFTLADEKGKLVSLSDYKGRYVVLEFWGTWCGYCLKDIPTMKEYYKKYKDRIEFIGIDCRDTESAWKLALEKYGINWINLLSVEDTLAKTYGIEGYPTKIILNDKGIIVGKYLGEASEFYSLLDELFKN